MSNIDDPTNVKPAPMKLAGQRDSSTTRQGQDKSLNKIQPNCELRRDASPLNNVNTHPLLKMNEYQKNCEQSDDSDSNCEFVVKQFGYNSTPVSASSLCTTTAAPKQTAKGNKGVSARITRTEPVPVLKTNSKPAIPVKSKEKEKDKGKDKEKEKEKEKDKEKKDQEVNNVTKERKESKERKDCVLKNKESNSKEVKSKDGKDVAKKHSKSNCNRVNKSNKPKEKEKEKEKEKIRDKDKEIKEKKKTANKK
ncbi:hypothetical protein RDWZM_004257 [Blomia tropicalis]|uniref:Uncharacterized protein n=1 Tax=Blomia tropicalis TaxID=40697 RepID=A0A9Q0MHB0_BLOTA|nr:hypothetical protein BLOT_016589 [Blomia tropicalis]KAJ6225712.1 hypothetical protein RDWZM_004257 [Blomia tropicalis]